MTFTFYVRAKNPLCSVDRNEQFEAHTKGRQYSHAIVGVKHNPYRANDIEFKALAWCGSEEIATRRIREFKAPQFRHVSIVPIHNVITSY